MRVTEEDKVRARLAVEEFVIAHADDAEVAVWAKDFLERLPKIVVPPQPVHWWKDDNVACGDHAAGSINSSPYRVTCLGCQKAIGRHVRKTMKQFESMLGGGA